MNLGEKINELRKRHQMTQEMLAEQLSVSPQAVSKWERGVANPDLGLIPALAAIATRWIIRFVEPPVAISTRIAFSIDFLFMISLHLISL